jgi:hypothetical protein
MTYAYHAAMKGDYGDNWRWGTPSTGWVNYEPERWYCIEQYVKMNTERPVRRARQWRW